MRPLLYAIPFFILSQNLYAQVVYPERPGGREFVVDTADLLEPNQRAEIAAICDRLLTSHKVPIYVVTISSLGDYGAGHWPIERYAMNLFGEWRIGFTDRNNGMLLLVAVGDRKARIELGSDWGRNQDTQANQIMNELIVPRFREGKYGEGILEGVKGLSAIGQGLKPPRGERRHRGGRGGGFRLGGFMWIFIIIIGFSVVGSMFGGGRRYGSGCGGPGLGCLGGMFLGSLFGRGFSSWGGGGGGGFSGFSGGGFGGGFSGGGGSTGSW